MTDIIKIPANTRTHLMAVRDEAVDKFDVADFTFEHRASTSGESSLLKIPAGVQAYLTAHRDEAVDVFDVVEFTWPYLNAAFPEPWAYWKMEEASGNRIDATGHGHDVTPGGYAFLPSMDAAGKISNCVKFYQTGGWSDAPHLGHIDSFALGADQNFTFAFWAKVHQYATPHSVLYYLCFGCDTNFWMNIYGSHNIWGCYDTAIWLCAGDLEMDIAPSTYDPEWYDYWDEGLVPDGVFNFTSDVWHFICMYYDGTGLYLEIDNSPIASLLGKHNAVEDPYVLIGDAEYGWSWADEVGVWTEALSPSQRTYLWNAGAGRTLYP